MNKYIISYKQHGVEHKARVEISSSDILGFITNNLPIHNNLLMKKLEEFRPQDMKYQLFTDKLCEEESV